MIKLKKIISQKVYVGYRFLLAAAFFIFFCRFRPRTDFKKISTKFRLTGLF